MTNNIGGSGCISALLIGMVVGLALWLVAPGHSSDLVPNSVRSTLSEQFGTYTQAYRDRQDRRRWKELCKGGGRYQAMSEAYDKGKPNPCDGSKQWVR